MKYIQKWKELWGNRQYHAMIVLGLYLVFFLSIFLLFSPKESTPKQKSLHGLELFKTISHYHYNVTGKNEFQVDVSKDVRITYLENQYSLQNIPLELQDFDFSLNFYDIILNGTLESTNYLEHRNTYLYQDKKIDVYYQEEDIYKVILYQNDYTVELEVDYD